MTALEPENTGFVTHRVEAATLTAEARAGSTLSLLRTLDDWLAGVTAAEGAVDATRETE